MSHKLYLHLDDLGAHADISINKHKTGFRVRQDEGSTVLPEVDAITNLLRHSVAHLACV